METDRVTAPVRRAAVKREFEMYSLPAKTERRSLGITMLLSASLLAALAAGDAPATETRAANAREERLRADVEHLAGAGGRGPGSTDLAAAAAYIEQRFRDAGLVPADEKAGYQQRFTPRAEAAREGAHLPPGTSWGSIELTNVMGRLAGSDPTAGCLVLGAHYDHLGVDASGVVYPGADDNASGVAALIEIARSLAEAGPLGRSVLFVAFAGEESGLLGSAAYVAAPQCPLTETVAMINLDTVGRMEGDKLYVFGSSSAVELPEIVRNVNLATGLDLQMPETGPFASDQASFFERGVPVLHLFSGPNVDYHRPSDTPDHIVYSGLSRVVDFTVELASYLGDREGMLSFVPPSAAHAQPVAPSGPPRRVSLGTIPDFARESGGVLLSGVMPASPAEKAGLAKGDLLIELAEVPIDNLADMSAALKSHAPGDTVRVVVLRGAERIERRVALVERK